MFRGLIVGAIASVVIAGSANAAVLTWTLQNVEFDDGGTASGTFDFDTTTNTYSNISITTTAGTANPGAVYSISDPANPGGPLFMTAVSGAMADFTGTPFLVFEWASALTDLGGAVAINIFGFTLESLCTESLCASVDGPANSQYRRVISGSVMSVVVEPPSEVPLPAALPLFLAGLAGFGVAKRRNRPASA